MKKQKSGLYRTKIKIGVDQAGKPVYKWLSAVTRAGLEEEKRRARDEYISGTGLREDQLFGVYATEWYKVRKAPSISPASQKLYRSLLNNHILPTFGDHNLRSIRPMAVQKFINDLDGSSGTMVRTIVAALRGIFSSAIQDRIIEQDPTTGLVKPHLAPPKEKRALTPDERQRLVNEALSHPDGLYVLLMYYLGLRSGEARGLMWGDVDWQHARISVERDVDQAQHDAIGELKTKTSRRVLPIPDELMEVLRQRRGLPGMYVVPGKRPGSPMGRSQCIRTFDAIRSAAGLPDGITAHWLRHNYATMCRDANLNPADTMYLLGHASYQTTLRVYTHITEQHLGDLAGSAKSIFKSCSKVAQESKNAKADE